MIANCIGAYWVNGELYVHQALAPEVVKVSVIAPDDPEFESMAQLAGPDPQQITQGDPS